MAIGTVKVTAKKIDRRDKVIKVITIAIILIFIFLAFIFMFLKFIYNGGRFVISLDPNFSLESGLYLYEDSETKDAKTRLQAKDVDMMDNISINWLPKDIDKEGEGSHNGENYIAHTFFIENRGTRTVDYWYEIYIENVIKNVDEAIRFMVILNGERKVYAKINNQTGEPEKNTIPFFSDEIAVLEARYAVKPGDIDRVTIVIWLEGDDPECLDNLISGEIKAS